MNIKFSKMQGLGNDFVVIDAIHQVVNLTPQQLRFIGDRHYGVGCDQILLVEKPLNNAMDFRYRIFNADGSEVAQCGNGARCFAKFIRDQGLTNADKVHVETNAGELTLVYKPNGLIQVDMGLPCFTPEKIPFVTDVQTPMYVLPVNGEDVSIGAVSMGNPHAVMVVTNVEQAPVARLGPLLASHQRFPDGVNVGFMEIVNRQAIKLRVYERGVGETFACGSGACAAVAIGVKNNQIDRDVAVSLLGGSLSITWPNDTASVSMVGPAAHVFSGELTV